MENKSLNISEELLKNLSIEQIADLKIEVEELLNKIEKLIKKCDKILEP